MKRFAATAVAVVTVVLALPVSALGQEIPEIEVPGLPDTAMTKMTSHGPVILINPVLYQAAGDARAFVKAHEIGHVLLGHLTNDAMATTLEGRAEAEREADCFAAERSSPVAVQAMVSLLLRQPPEARDAIYGTKPERARRILACAAGRPSVLVYRPSSGSPVMLSRVPFPTTKDRSPRIYGAGGAARSVLEVMRVAR